MNLLLAAIVLAPAQNAFQAYLKKPDPSYSWRSKAASGNQTEIQLTSQTWQGHPWHHAVLLQQPARSEVKGTAVLYITGDGPTSGDRFQIQLFSGAAGMPVAMLFNVPNQPIWNMREDDLIAHTFQRYLATDDKTWPLLFPMTKSAIRAMDAIQAATKDGPNPIKRFVITGASKRGWTTWLVAGSGDKRIAGIAPMVYDNLNLPAQMKHQIASWGKYSEMIQDYTRRGLQQKLATAKGRELSGWVDPYNYLNSIKMPVLIVNGANDRYWTVDATSQYWNDLKAPKWMRVIPNVGHDLGGGVKAAESIGAFAQSVAGSFPMPQISWGIKPSRVEKPALANDKRRLEVWVKSQTTDYQNLKVWIAESETTDFRDSKWEVAIEFEATKPNANTMNSGKNRIHFVDVAKAKNVAVFAEMGYQAGGRKFSLTTPVKVLKK